MKKKEIFRINRANLIHIKVFKGKEDLGMDFRNYSIADSMLFYSKLFYKNYAITRYQRMRL